MNLNQQPDPRLRQMQLERCREELCRYEGYCQERQRRGEQPEPPRFNEYGQIINMPPNLRYAGLASNLPAGIPFGQVQNNGEQFTVVHTVTEDRSSAALMAYEQFRGHPLVPNDLVPKNVIFVYEKAEVVAYARKMKEEQMQKRASTSAGPRTVDAAVGEYSVVRYNVETQTEPIETLDKERHGRHSSAADNNAVAKPIMTVESKEAPTAVVNQPIDPEFNMTVQKVAQWLNMAKGNDGQQLNHQYQAQGGPVSLMPPSYYRQPQKYGYPGKKQYYGRPANYCPPQPHQHQNFKTTRENEKDNVPSTIGRHSHVEMESKTKTIASIGSGGYGCCGADITTAAAVAAEAVAVAGVVFKKQVESAIKEASGGHDEKQIVADNATRPAIEQLAPPPPLLETAADESSSTEKPDTTESAAPSRAATGEGNETEESGTAEPNEQEPIEKTSE